MLFTRIISVKPARLCKQYSLSPSGELQKKSAGQLVVGQFDVINLNTPTEFANLLASLNNNEALCYGRPSADSGQILSQKRKDRVESSGAITRTREGFDWPSGPAIFFGDYDPHPGSDPLTPEEVRAIICQIEPKLNDAAMVLWHSASSHIYHKESGEALKGPGGVRIYILVADGHDIPRLGEILSSKFWLSGYGRYICSKSGALLDRSLLDASVWQPERLDFASGAYIAENELIEQKRPHPQVINPEAAPFDSRLIADLTAEEKSQLTQIKSEAREKIKPVQDKVREEWIQERLDCIEDESEKTRKRNILKNAAIDYVLHADFELITSKGHIIKVGDILENPGQWHNTYIKDPLEPEYNGSSNVAWINAKKGVKPYIYSHAHGGQHYTLCGQTITLTLSAGNLPTTLNDIAKIISVHGEMYQRGGMLVRIADDEIIAVTLHWLKNHIEQVIKFNQWDARAKSFKTVGCCTDLVSRYLDNRGGWKEPELSGIINAPIFRPDGSLLSEPGYDETTKLLLRGHDRAQFPTVPINPSPQQLFEAFITLFEPFQYFPFVSPDDAAGALAAMLTAIQRPILPTAPAFGFNAHVAGSGKSYIAKAISWLSGNEPREMPWSTEAEEQRKRLTAALLNGHSSILIDNVNGMLDSDTLCSILTGERYEDRRLGFSENVKLSTRALFVITGNNVTVVKDLWRRVIVITIDHGTDKPSKKSFPFNPVARVRDNWLKYRTAGLTILSAYIAAGSPRITNDSVGSFEVWDNMIRQCILWLGKFNFHLSEPVLPKLGDPVKLLDNAYENDPELERLKELLTAWFFAYQDQQKTIAEVIRQAACVYSDQSSYGISEELLIDISGGNKPNSRMVAAFLRRNSGKRVNGYVINKGRTSGTRTTWFVQRVAE